MGQASRQIINTCGKAKCTGVKPGTKLLVLGIMPSGLGSSHHEISTWVKAKWTRVKLVTKLLVLGVKRSGLGSSQSPNYLVLGVKSSGLRLSQSLNNNMRYGLGVKQCVGEYSLGLVGSGNVLVLSC